jgi:hypothetical protein
MYTFDLRAVTDGYELRGGPLDAPMIYREKEARSAVHLVGFLSQKSGSELRIFDAEGELANTRHFRPVLPLAGAVGGLQGPADMARI